MIQFVIRRQAEKRKDAPRSAARCGGVSETQRLLNTEHPALLKRELETQLGAQRQLTWLAPWNSKRKSNSTSYRMLARELAKLVSFSSAFSETNPTSEKVEKISHG
jgi:hypothetical protein